MQDKVIDVLQIILSNKYDAKITIKKEEKREWKKS